MALINPIKYIMFNDQVVPSNRLPLIEVQSDEMAYGQILLKLPQLTNVTSTIPHIYKVAAPTTDDNRWIRLTVDLHPTYP